LFEGVYAFPKMGTDPKNTLSFGKPYPGRKFNTGNPSLLMRFMRTSGQRLIQFGSISPMESIRKASGHVTINRYYEELNL
jgi:hypothetical protein